MVGWQVDELFLLLFLLPSLFLSFHPLLGLVSGFTKSKVRGELLTIVFNLVNLSPDSLRLDLGLLGIHSLLIFPFDPLFLIDFMFEYIVLDPFQDDHLVELPFRFRWLVRIMLQFNALPDAVQLKHFLAFADGLRFLLTKRVQEFVTLFSLECFEVLISFDPVILD